MMRFPFMILCAIQIKSIQIWIPSVFPFIKMWKKKRSVAIQSKCKFSQPPIKKLAQLSHFHSLNRLKIIFNRTTVVAHYIAFFYLFSLLNFTIDIACIVFAYELSTFFSPLNFNYFLFRVVSVCSFLFPLEMVRIESHTNDDVCQEDDNCMRTALISCHWIIPKRNMYIVACIAQISLVE